jgi:hypothetical protein
LPSCCRLEVGLQSTYEDVARDTNRGHTVASVGECFRMAKNAGFKVGCWRAESFCCAYAATGAQFRQSGMSWAVVGMQVIAHMMPDLPNVGWERDLESFREFFENPAFRSDGLKVCSAAGCQCNSIGGDMPSAAGKASAGGVDKDSTRWSNAGISHAGHPRHRAI